MKTVPLLAAFLTFAAPFARAGENRLADSDFAGGTVGSAPVKPWLVTKDSPGITVKLETLPAGKAGVTDPAKRWVHLLDESADQPAGLRQNFDPVTAGRLRWRIYFQALGSPFSVLLGDANVSKPETRVFELKMNKNGQVSVGNSVNRTKTAFVFRTGEIYDLYCDFKPAADNKTLTVEVGLTGGEMLFTGSTDAARAVSGLRITSDLAGMGLDAFVTDVTLTADR